MFTHNIISHYIISLSTCTIPTFTKLNNLYVSPVALLNVWELYLLESFILTLRFHNSLFPSIELWWGREDFGWGGVCWEGKCMQVCAKSGQQAQCWLHLWLTLHVKALRAPQAKAPVFRRKNGPIIIGVSRINTHTHTPNVNLCDVNSRAV